MSLLAAVRTDFSGFAGMLSRTQKKLRQAADSIEDAQRHSQTIAKRLSDVGELPEKQAQQLLGGEDEPRDAFDEDDEWD